jgi:hypothetical protein
MIFSKYRGFPVSLGLFHNSNQISGGKKTYHLLVSRIGAIFFLELDWTVFWKAGCNVDPICFAAWGASSQVRTDNTMNKNYQIAVVNDVWFIFPENGGVFIDLPVNQQFDMENPMENPPFLAVHGQTQG